MRYLTKNITYIFILIMKEQSVESALLLDLHPLMCNFFLIC